MDERPEKDEQREIVAALADPAAYPHRPERVVHLQTHLSHVFVAEPFAYKLKKPVRLSFVDFGTRERRRESCETEVRLNRRLCAPIYLGVAAVTRSGGRWTVGTTRDVSAIDAVGAPRDVSASGTVGATRDVAASGTVGATRASGDNPANETDERGAARGTGPSGTPAAARRAEPSGTAEAAPEDEAAPEAGAHAAETLVCMRALPASGMLPAALREGRVDARLLASLARDLARFHERAPAAEEWVATAGLEGLRRRFDDVLENADDLVGTVLSRADRALLADFGERFLATHADLVRARQSGGRIREGHGDLHAANVCLVEPALPAVAGAPPVAAGLWAFDCIEFSSKLRSSDVASEVAFLAMDLTVAGRPDLAEAFVDAYEDASGDRDLRALLPYYVAHRACVRGMVHGRTSRDPGVAAEERRTAEERSASYFAHATRTAWLAGGPALIACMGLSGTGKTTLAIALAERAGAVLVSSDELRKRRAGLDPRKPAPTERAESLYADEARHATYRDLAAAASEALVDGRLVIADATFTAAADRALVAEVARRHGVPHVLVECAAEPEVIRARLEKRARAGATPGAPALSDAGWDVYLRQRREADPLRPDEPSLRVDASGDAAEVLERALEQLWSWRREHPVAARRG